MEGGGGGGGGGGKKKKTPTADCHVGGLGMEGAALERQKDREQVGA